MKLKIFGPNLRDQSKGQFVVHAYDCADCAKLHKLRENVSANLCATQQEVVELIYEDIIAEGETWQSCAGEVHFAPCTGELS